MILESLAIAGLAWIFFGNIIAGKVLVGVICFDILLILIKRDLKKKK